MTSKPGLSPFSKFFIWLAGADDDKLANCPKWERRKYEAFGATVLVPTLFGIIACAYAVSTLTPDPKIIIPIALVWAFIILSIDRALLASYRAFVTGTRKYTQFFLRFLVAVLMGFSISHPLTLLLFKDTIAERIEQRRDGEMAQIRDSAREQRQLVDSKISATLLTLSEQRKAYEDTIGGDFLTPEPAAGEDKQGELIAVSRTVLDEQIKLATQAQVDRLNDLKGEIAKVTKDRDLIQAEVTHWQDQYEKEVGGERSGTAGVGPRAKSILADQLEPRRKELARLTQQLETLGVQENQLAVAIADTEHQLRSEYAEDGAEAAAQARQEEMELASMQRQLQKQRVSTFMNKQGDLLGQMEAQLNSTSAELDRLRAESNKLSETEQRRLDKVEERRMDLLTQSIVLHEDLFHESSMAFSVWLILALLFMLIDTIPLVVKFFSKPGLYDIYIEEEEKTIDRLREAVASEKAGMMDHESVLALANAESNRLLAFRSLGEVVSDSNLKGQLDLKLQVKSPAQAQLQEMLPEGTPAEVLEPTPQEEGSTEALSEPAAQPDTQASQPEPEPAKPDTGKIVTRPSGSEGDDASTELAPAKNKSEELAGQLLGTGTGTSTSAASTPAKSPAKSDAAVPAVKPGSFHTYQGQNLPGAKPKPTPKSASEPSDTQK